MSLGGYQQIRRMLKISELGVEMGVLANYRQISVILVDVGEMCMFFVVQCGIYGL